MKKMFPRRKRNNRVLYIIALLLINIAVLGQTKGVMLGKPSQPAWNTSCSGTCESTFLFSFNDSNSVFSGNLGTQKFWKFDRTSNSYLQLNYPSGVTGSVITSFVIENKGYVLVKNGFTKRLYEYNSSTNTWVSKQEFVGTSSYSSASFVLNGKAYIVSGTTSGGKQSYYSYTDEVWEYNPSLDIFIQKSKLPLSGRLTISSAAGNKVWGFEINNKGYLLWDHFNFFEYDPIIDRWISKPAPISYMDVPRCQNANVACYLYNAFSYNSYGYYTLINTMYPGDGSFTILKYDPIYEIWSKDYTNSWYDWGGYWIVNAIVKTPRNIYAISDEGVSFNEWTPNDYVVYSSQISTPFATCITSSDSLNLQMKFTALGNYNSVNNRFYLQLSDANGLFNNAKNIDSLLTGTSNQYVGTFNTKIAPIFWDTALNYKLRVVTSSPYSDDEFWTLIKKYVVISPDTTIKLTGTANFCSGSFVTLQASTGVGFSYKWYKNGLLINGVTTSSYSASTSGDYYCSITNSQSCTVNTRTINVNVISNPTTPSISATGNLTFCSGGSVILNVTLATGLTCQWRKDGVNINGATTPSYTATLPGNYTVVVTNGSNCSSTSNSIQVIVNTTPTTPIISASGSTTFCNGGNVILSYSGGSGLTYQWKRDGINITGATTSSYNATLAGSYTLVATNSSNCSSTSTSIEVTVNAIPQTPTISASGSTAFCNGGNVILNSSGGLGLSYQWKKDGVNIAGATMENYTATTMGIYTLVATNGSNCSSTSNAIQVTVNSTPGSPTISVTGPTTICSGESVVINAISGTGLTYQWKRDGVNISGATAVSYTATIPGIYTLVVTNSSNCSSTSNAIQVNVNSTPSSPTISVNGSTNFCQGGSVTLISSSVNGNQWFNNGVPISGATGSTYIATAAGSYTVAYMSGTCRSFISNPILVTVSLLPTSVITVAGSTIFCTGESVFLSANDGPGLTYQWKRDGVNIPNANGLSYIATSGGNYTVQVTNVATSCFAVSTGVPVVVNPIPPKPAITNNGSNFVSNISIGNQWYLNGNIIPGATAQSHTPAQTGNYSVKVTLNNCTGLMSDPVYYLATSVNDLNESEYIKIGPNPVITKLYVSFHLNNLLLLKTRVINTLGVVVSKEVSIRSGQIINLSTLPSGLYWLILETPDRKRVFKYSIVN